jgi:hypothetical protein
MGNSKELGPARLSSEMVPRRGVALLMPYMISIFRC